MSDDLRALLGDRCDDVISEAARQMHIAHWVEAMQPLDGERPEVQAARVWEATPEPRAYFIPLAEGALAAVLPDLLAAERERASADLDRIARALADAWDAGMEFVRSHPDMAAEYYRDANPYRKEIPDAAR